MLANLQKFITFAVFAAALSIAFLFAADGHRSLAGVAFVAVIFSYAIVLAAEFAMVYSVGTDSNRRAKPLVLIRAWVLEAFTTPRVFFWRQPFCSGQYSDFLSGELEARRGVVLVHGLFCNRGFWNPWLLRLRASQIPFVAVSLEPTFGSIDLYCPAIDRAVKQVESATGLPVILVGHSMGGLAIRSWMSACSARARVHHVFTIGAPHRGTWLARFSTAANGKQMQIASSWLKRLAANESTWSPERMTCFYSDCDNVVFPMTCATLDNASNIHVPGLGHVRLAFDEAIVEAVCNLALASDAIPQSEQ